MIEIQKFREQGYIYDSMENYSDLISFDDVKNIKKTIDSIDYKIPSKYDYWYKYNDLSYMEELNFSTFVKNDENEKRALEVFDIANKYYIEKMKNPKFYPTWVFGTSLNDNIVGLMNNGILSSFQNKFARYYYSDKMVKYTKCSPDFRLQFYDEGCQIKLHDDGAPEDRLCVFLYFLNSEWSDENGGHLIIHTKNNESIKINPVFPNFVVLDSDINLFHELEMVKKEVKYNIVCFYSGMKS